MSRGRACRASAPARGRGVAARLVAKVALGWLGVACAPADDVRVSAAARLDWRLAAPSAEESRPLTPVMEIDPEGRLVIAAARAAWFSPFIEPEGQWIPHVELESGSCGGHLSCNRQVIRDEPTFRRFWNLLHPGPHRARRPPKVDFGKETLLFVPMGEKPELSYTLQVQKVIRDEHAIVVLVDEHWPALECTSVSSLAESNPYQLVSIERSTLPVVWAIGYHHHCPWDLRDVDSKTW